MNLIVIFEYIPLQFDEKVFIMLPHKTEKRSVNEIAKEIDGIVENKDLHFMLSNSGKLYGLSKVAIV